MSSFLTQCAEDSIPSFGTGFDYCAPNYVFGEVTHVIVAPIGIPDESDYAGNPWPTDVSDMGDWDALIGAGFAQVIPIKGTLDEPERPEIDTSLGRKAYPPPRYTLTGQVDDLPADVYEGMRNLSNKSVRFWFLSGGYIFGGAQGLRSDVNTWLTIEEGEESVHKYNVSFTWKSEDRLAPARAIAPQDLS